jgi:LPPG:FO 2-phospho-L-lactate transferase
MLVALAGGVGAARFLRGLVDVVDPTDVVAVVNTGDDDHFHGLHVSPDLDSVTYTLADANNLETGWGLAGETFATMDAIDRYGAPTWFRLGDRDLATHLFRTEALRGGATLTDATARIAAAWGVRSTLLPMSDDRIATRITVARDGGIPEMSDRERGIPGSSESWPERPGAKGTESGTVELAMQEWFVRERAEPPVVSVRFDGAEDSRPAPGVLEAIDAADTIVVCPSNPVISIGPILAVPGVRDALVRRRDRVVGVSPIIGGRPVRGPADRLMGPLGIEVSCVGVARAYRDFCAALVIDGTDATHASAVDALGVRSVVADTLMRDARVAAALARDTLAAVA